MPRRLPLAAPADLMFELELIAEERQKVLAVHPSLVINPEGRANKLDSLDEWENDLRRQLAEALTPTRRAEASDVY